MYNHPFQLNHPEPNPMGIQHASKALRNAAKKRNRKRKQKLRSTKKYKR